MLWNTVMKTLFFSSQHSQNQVRRPEVQEKGEKKSGAEVFSLLLTFASRLLRFFTSEIKVGSSASVSDLALALAWLGPVVSFLFVLSFLTSLNSV